MIDAFEAAHPGTKVNYTRFVNDESGNVKLDTTIAGGVPIDVIWTYSPDLLQKRASGGVLLDLTDRLAADQDLTAFGAQAQPVSNYVIDGKTYGVPCSITPPLVMANATLFEQAGIALPTQWTWDDYRETARRLSAAGRFGMIAPPDTTVQVLGANAMYTTEGKSNFANPAFAADLRRALDMQAEKSVMDVETVLAEKLRVFVQGPFVQQRVAMLQGSVLFITRYLNDLTEYPHDFKVACLPYPKPSSGDSWDQVFFGDLASVTAKSKNPDLAYEFIRFYMLNAAELIPGRPPALLGSTSVDAYISTMLGPDMDKLYVPDTFRSVLFDAPKPTRPAVDTIFHASAQLTQIRQSLADEVLLGTRSVESWATEAVKQADQAIAVDQG